MFAAAARVYSREIVFMFTSAALCASFHAFLFVFGSFCLRGREILTEPRPNATRAADSVPGRYYA